MSINFGPGLHVASGRAVDTLACLPGLALLIWIMRSERARER